MIHGPEKFEANRGDCDILQVGAYHRSAHFLARVFSLPGREDVALLGLIDHAIDNLQS